ncbi:MAG: hypothetical protein AAFQ87_15540, partial [Bacteroidota bacterium]
VDRKLEVRVVVARPLFKARNQDEANAYYQQQLAQYETELENWQQDREAIRSRKATKKRLQKEYAQAIRKWQVQSSDTLSDSTQQQDDFALYRFKVDQLGVYEIAGLAQRPAFERAVWLTDSLGNPLNAELLASGIQPVMIHKNEQLYRGQYRNDTLFFPAFREAYLLLNTPEGELAQVDQTHWQEAGAVKQIQAATKPTETTLPPA